MKAKNKRMIPSHISVAHSQYPIRKLILLLAISLILPILTANSESLDKRLGKCVVMTGSLERLSCFEASTSKATDPCSSESLATSRLACFDKWSKNKGVTTQVAKNKYGKWRVTTKTNPNNTSDVYLSLNAENLFTNAYVKKKPTMHLKCLNNKTEAFIDFKSLASVFVKVRFDKNKPYRQTWQTSSDPKSHTRFIPQPISFIRKLIEHKSFIVEAENWSKDKQLIEFDVAGTKESIHELRTACHW